MRRFAVALAPVLVILWLAVVLVMAATVWIVLRSVWTGYTRPGQGYGRAPEGAPVLRALERERVTFLRTQDWCQAYDDGSGARANTLRPTCTLAHDDAETFDPVSRARYETLAHLADDLPYDMHYVQIRYGDDGRMERADISLATFFSRASLVYDPGYSIEELQGGDSPDPTTYTPIDADWYHKLEDWN